MNLRELEAAAKEKLPQMAWDYYASGADDERCVRRNCEAFEKARDPAAADVFDRMHQSLRSTRGAAVSIAALPATGDVTFMGVGNVARVDTVPMP